MALRVINGGRKDTEATEDSGEEFGAHTARTDATEAEVDDDDDDGMGSSTIIGAAPVPPKARAFGVGSVDLDDSSIDDALSGIEERASVALPPGPQVPVQHYPGPVPPGPQVPAKYFPSSSTHGRAASSHDTSPHAPAYPPYGRPTPTGPVQYFPSTQTPYPGSQTSSVPWQTPTGQVPYDQPTGHLPTGNQYAQSPSGLMNTPMPTAAPAPAPKSNAVLFAAIGGVVVIALGGIAAYTVLAKSKTESKSGGTGSAQVATVGSGGSATTTGSAGSAATTGSAGSAGSAAVATTGSGGSAEVGSAVEVGSGGSAATPVLAKIQSDFTRVEHPAIGDNITAQNKGQLSAVAVPTVRDVKAGDNLFTIKSRSGANVDALEKKVRDMEAMAKEDPDSYGPFLKRARAELRNAQAPVVNTIKAPSAGTFQSKVKVGDQVTPGTVLGSFVDGKSWIGVADMEGSPTARWICTVGDNTHTAPCEIQGTEVINGGSGTRVTVTITATGTSWLSGPSKSWLSLEPP